MALLGQSDKSLLGDRRPVGDFPQGCDIRPHADQLVFQQPSISVVSDNANADGFGPQSGQIGSDGSGPPATVFGLRYLQYRDRCLGADPKGVAVDVDVQHEVADDKDIRRTEVANRL